MLDLAEPGNTVAVRPSGTEPKVKFYVLTRLPVAQSQNAMEAAKSLQERMSRIETDVRAFAGSIG
jgi:phosphoglucomutase/phosphomannomutase